MNIAYCARRETEASVAEELDATFYPDLSEMLGVSDFVSLHVPGGAETERMIDAKAIAAMKPGAHLINTARGPIVDEAALMLAYLSCTAGGRAIEPGSAKVSRQRRKQLLARAQEMTADIKARP